MKTTMKLKEQENVTFPCLMINNTETIIVLMRAKKSGVVVHAEPEARWSVGTDLEYWDMRKFTKFSGVVVIDNGEV